jgi:hypothetical protein
MPSINGETIPSAGVAISMPQNFRGLGIAARSSWSWPRRDIDSATNHIERTGLGGVEERAHAVATEHRGAGDGVIFESHDNGHAVTLGTLAAHYDLIVD